MFDYVTHTGKAHLTYFGRQQTLCGRQPPTAEGKWYYRLNWDGYAAHLCAKCLEEANAVIESTYAIDADRPDVV